MQRRPDAGKERQGAAPSGPAGNLKLYATTAALGLLALLLFVHQYTTMARFGMFPPGRTYGTVSSFRSEVLERIEFTLLDYALLTAIAGLFLALLAAEFRNGCLTSLLRASFTGERLTTALLAVAGLVAVRHYLGLGSFSWGGDQPQHICFAHMASRSIAEGELPIWTNYLGTGTPYLQFYGFLFFYLTGLVDQLWNDIFASLKAVMAVLHVASGLAMYLLARTVTRSRKAGFIAGLAYVLSFWHTQQIIIMGRFPLSLFYALLPLPFYFFERLSSPCLAGNRARLAVSLAGGICLGALILTHPGYGFWATVLLGLYVGLRVLLQIPASERPGLAGWSAVLFAGGLVSGGYLTLPMWLEREHTALYRGMLNLSGIPVPTWEYVLSWSNYRFWVLRPPDLLHLNWYGGYLGLSLTGIVAGGAAAALGSRSRELILRFLPPFLCLALTVLLVFGYRWSPLQSLPIVTMMGSGRYLSFTVFFLSLAAAPAVQALMVLLRGRGWRVPVSTLILCLIAVDLGPTTFQQMYSTVDPAANMFPQIRAPADSVDAQGQLPSHRVLWSGPRQVGNLLKGHLYFQSRTPRPGSFHPGRARATVDFVEPVDRYLSKLVEAGYFAGDRGNADQQGSFPETIFGRGHEEIILAGLNMMDVRYLVLSDSDGQISIGDMSEFGHSGPVLVSPRTVPFPARKLDQLIAGGESSKIMESKGVDPGFTKMLMDSYNALFLVANTAVDLNTRGCERIFVLDAEGQELGTNPAAEVLEHTVRTQRVDLKLRVGEACFARLAYSWFPHLRVTVDGREVAPLRTAGGFMAVQLEAGEHDLTLEAKLSPLRRGLLAVNLFYLAATVFLLVDNRRKR